MVSKWVEEDVEGEEGRQGRGGRERGRDEEIVRSVSNDKGTHKNKRI